MTALDNPYIQPNDGPWMRKYLNWAQPHYDKALPELRADMVAIDRWLYGGGAKGVWLGLALGFGCLVLGLYLAGLPFWVACTLGVCVAFICTVAVVRAWFSDDLLRKKPGKKSGKSQSPWLGSPWFFSIGLPFVVLLGALTGHLVAKLVKAPSGLSLEAFTALAFGSLTATAPYGLALAGAVAAVVTVTLAVKQQRLKFRLERVQLLREREQLTAAATQAKLKLLQAQIKPHFLFNTLAALQHWTDTQDPRAPVLLQSLTGFLRRSTDAMDADLVSLGTELALCHGYLAIMAQRLGQKLQHSVDVATPLLSQQIPPALLLSLIENALEHGIEPSMAGGEVRISAQRLENTLVLEVHNTGVALDAAAAPGVGLANSRARLQAHFGDKASLHLSSTPQGTVARVNLPFFE